MLKLIKGNFSNTSEEPKMSLKSKISEALEKFSDDDEHPFILVVDTGEDLTIFSDIEVERFNLLLDTIKLTTITGGAL